MLPECPDDLKHLLPYLQRSSEMKNRDPIVSYFCGFYAANLAIQKGYPKTPINESFLMALLDELGAEKEDLKNEPALQDNSVARSHLIQFSLKIFLAADNEDRAGQATKKTARLFLVASQFLEVLRVFGDVGDEIEEKIRYAKWKASDIIKAVNEGRQPVAGPPGSIESPNEQLHMAGEFEPTHDHPPAEDRRKSSASSDRNLPSMSGAYTGGEQSYSSPTYHAPPPPANYNSLAPEHDQPTYYVAPPFQPQPPPAPAQPQAPPSNYTPPPPSNYGHPAAPPTQPYVPPSNYAAAPPQQPPAPTRNYPVAPHATFDQAEKHCRYAISAIQFEDIRTAIREMETAIGMLQSLQR